MPAYILIPSPLRAQAGGQDSVAVGGGTVKAALADLVGQFPTLQERLFDQGGGVRRFINLYVNDEDVRFLDDLATPLKDGDTVSIIPAVAGG